MDLYASLSISAAGMKAQGTRLRIVSENIANADSTATTPGGDPYRRKVVTFANQLDRAVGAQTVQVNRVTFDPSEFGFRHDPAHPAANAEGYVATPNVNALVELADMREAHRTYEANLRVQQTARSMLEQTIGLLR